MKNVPRPEDSGFTRLRDFGAFQTKTPLPLSAPGEYMSVPYPPALSVPHPVTHRERLERLQRLSVLSARRSALQAVVTTPLPEVARQEVREGRNRWARVSIQVGITFALLWFMSRSISWASLISELGHVHKGLLLIAVIVGTGGVVLSAYQWRSLLRTTGLQFDLAVLIDLYLVGIAFSHLLPTGMGGDAVKALSVGKGDDERARSTGALILCRITGFMAMLLIALPALFLWHAQLNTQLCFLLCLLIVLTGSAICGGFCLLSLLPRFMFPFVQRFALLKRLGELCAMVRQQGWPPLALLQATGYGWIFWSVAILNCYCYAQALGLEIPLYFFLIAVPFAALISFIPASLNGFGLREGAFVFAFTTIHVSSAHALLLALLLDLQALCFAAFGIYLYIFRINKRRSSASVL